MNSHHNKTILMHLTTLSAIIIAASMTGCAVGGESEDEEGLALGQSQESIVTACPSGQMRVNGGLTCVSADLVQKFAPRLRFDGAGHGYPMSAQPFYKAVVVQGQSYFENTDPSTLGSGTLPTYYQIIGCGSQIRIRYWWFYGNQIACDGVSGAHQGDWEDVTVTLSEDTSTVAAVTFTMHGKDYTRLNGSFTTEDGTHPVVYVAKNSHASIYESGGTSTTCLPWEEFRNNSTGTHLDSWQNLVNLDSSAQPWVAADRNGGFTWGDSDACSTHPTQKAPTCNMKAASWDNDVNTRLHTQCKSGDVNTGVECIGQCSSGYTNTGILCSKCGGDWWNPGSWSCDTYSPRYGYDYMIPTTDSGLL